MVRKGGGVQEGRERGKKKRGKRRSRQRRKEGKGEKDSLPGAFVEVQRRVWPHSHT